MPTYDYRCVLCKTVFSRQMPVAERDLPQMHCGTPAQREVLYRVPALFRNPLWNEEKHK